MSQATELPRTEVRGLQSRQTGGFSPRDIHARGEAYPLPQDAADFHRSYVAWQCHGLSRAGGDPRPRPLDSGSKPAPYHDAGAGMTRDRRHFHPLMWPSQGHSHSERPARLLSFRAPRAPFVIPSGPRTFCHSERPARLLSLRAARAPFVIPSGPRTFCHSERPARLLSFRARGAQSRNLVSPPITAVIGLSIPRLRSE